MSDTPLPIPDFSTINQNAQTLRQLLSTARQYNAQFLAATEDVTGNPLVTQLRAVTLQVSAIERYISGEGLDDISDILAAVPPAPPEQPPKG